MTRSVAIPLAIKTVLARTVSRGKAEMGSSFMKVDRILSPLGQLNDMGGESFSQKL
jgi:hypothetical protein